MTYYDSISEGYDELYGAEQLEKAKIILGLIRPKRTDKLLDVGCGTGSFLELCKCDAVGIDPSVELLKKSKGNVMLGVAEALPFDDNTFDYVVSITAIHHFEDLDKAISEIKRVGKKRVVISTLKNSSRADEIEKKLGKEFDIEKIVVEKKDVIFLLNIR